MTAGLTVARMKKNNTEKDMMIPKKSREMAKQSPHVNDVFSPIQTNSTLTMKS